MSDGDAEESVGRRSAYSVLRTEVANDLSSILTLPPETSQREIVELIPRDLLREKVIATRQPRELRDLGVVSERVGEPESAAIGTESRLEVALTEEELSNERFSRREKLVRFDPHTT
jgi:hypothetical protein